MLSRYSLPLCTCLFERLSFKDSIEGKTLVTYDEEIVICVKFTFYF